MSTRPLRVFLGGDVMTGRGIDQILPHPGDPRLREEFVRDARSYVELAERAGGPVGYPVGPAWPWGDALAVLDDAAPDARLVNLETAVTRDGVFEPGKGIHYRMHPANMPCLIAARPDVCALANNHVLDFGPRALADTLDSLVAAGIRPAGAGRAADEAAEPAIVPVAGEGRLVVFAFGTTSSGIPPGWAAAPDRPGVAVLPDLSARTAGEILARVRRVRRPGDTVVVSLHWGSNWGYDVPAAHVRFAHRLAAGGVDVVFGHSSHHPRPIEVHRGKLILYGCGDLIDDYEGIGGHERYRGDLRVLYLADLRRDTGDLVRLRMVPMRARRMRLRQAGTGDVDQVREVLDRISRPFGTAVDVAESGCELGVEPRRGLRDVLPWR